MRPRMNIFIGRTNSQGLFWEVLENMQVHQGNFIEKDY